MSRILFRVGLRPISRGKGMVSVATAAYNAGVRLHHERENTTYEFGWRDGVVYSALIGAEGWTRQKLWNEAEWAEKKWHGVTARELIITLPRGLSLAQAAALAEELGMDFCASYGSACDVTMHAVRPPRPREVEFHVHLLMSRRVMTPQGLGERIDVFDDNPKWKSARKGRKGPEEVKKVRFRVAEIINKALRRAGIEETVDPRSYLDQGIIRVPGVHLGRVLTTLERAGFTTELGDYNRDAKWYNRLYEFLGDDFDPFEAIERRRTPEQVIREYHALGGRIRFLGGLLREIDQGRLDHRKDDRDDLARDRRTLVGMRLELRPQMHQIVRKAKRDRAISRTIGRGRGL